ncbi:MAG TPA: LLM class flavin-dependent oxidoreductase [Thermoplasmata archaeon]
MELSAFTVLDEYPEDTALGRDRYGEVFDLARASEDAGLSAVWVAEHHFHSGGVCPSPPVLLAALGARTRTIRLGAMVSVLPFHDPILVAEEYAMVDRLTGGRLRLGVGSGYIPMEFQGFGIDPATKRERFDRSYDRLLAAFRGEPVRGESGSGAGETRLNVRPVQRPHPPIWIAVQRREALEFVARRGVGVALIPYATVSGVVELESEIREYRSHLPPGVVGRVSVALHVYAGDDLAMARSALQRYLDSRRATQSTFYEEKVRRDPSQASAESVERAGFAVFGSPASVVAKLDEFRRAGVDEVLGLFDFGGLPTASVSASVTRLGAAWPRAP